MPVSKFSVSLSAELARALGLLADERSEDRSRLIETLLRESPLVQDRIRELRTGPTGLKKGRDPEELRLLARVARRAWNRRMAAGRVRIHGQSR